MGPRPEIFTAWRMANDRLEDAPKHNEELRRSIFAHKWAVNRILAGAPKLLLSPTVQEELANSDQVAICNILNKVYLLICNTFMQYQFWVDRADIGMKEVAKLRYVVKESDLALVRSQLNGRLRENAHKIPGGDEEGFYASAVHASEDLNTISKYKADLKIYMECCAISNDSAPGPDLPLTKLLVTEDYKFFRSFVRSRYAEEVLQELVMTVLQLKTGIKVLLAGEVIKGV